MPDTPATETVPFLDLGRLHDSIRDELDAAWDATLRDSGFVGAATCAGFEEAFAEAHGVAAAAGVNSGTDAITLALRAAGIGAGDEVLVPSMTFFATAEAVLLAGATPVVVDVAPDTALLDDRCIPEGLLERATAVLPVHLYGNCVPFDVLDRLSARGLTVIEDAAQAHLATWNGRPVGSSGRAAAFSFFPGKNLGAFGDAGLVASDDTSLVEEVKLLRDHGRASKYRHDVIGMSSRMDGLQAAVLAVKLRHLPRWNGLRRDRADDYRRLLEASDPGIRLLPWQPGSVHHLLVAEADSTSHRDFLRTYCADHGVSTGVHYPLSLVQQPALAPFRRPTPVADDLAARLLSLPLDPLMSPDDVERVVATLVDARRAWHDTTAAEASA